MASSFSLKVAGVLNVCHIFYSNDGIFLDKCRIAQMLAYSSAHLLYERGDLVVMTNILVNETLRSIVYSCTAMLIDERKYL